MAQKTELYCPFCGGNTITITKEPYKLSSETKILCPQGKPCVIKYLLT
jgi:hypothetical protein